MDLALERGVRIDAAHALVSDAATAAFGHRLFEWVSGALAAEGRDPEGLTALLDDEPLVERVLEQVRARMGEDDEAPDPPGEEHGWYAYSPGDPHGSRSGLRRAAARRREQPRAGDRPGTRQGSTCRSANARAISTCRMVSSITREPWPASKRYTSCSLPSSSRRAR